jgi:hypothetical protein
MEGRVPSDQYRSLSKDEREDRKEQKDCVGMDTKWSHTTSEEEDRCPGNPNYKEK